MNSASHDDLGLPMPPPGAPPAERMSYREAYSARAREIHRQHLQKLHNELQTKIRDSDRERALCAFHQVLDTAGVTAWNASSAQLKLEAWDIAGFPEDDFILTPEEGRAAVAWGEAVEAGRVELCVKAPFVSEEAFGLVDFLGREWGGDDVFSLRLSGN